MTYLTETRYRRQLAVAMVAYVAAMLLVWPHARADTSVPLKVLWAVAPVLPMLYAIALVARRIGASDEFEQRVHLLAVAASAALTGALSLIGGFLAAAGVLALDGSVLLWVFPLLMLGYGAARWWWLVRHYGGTLACNETPLAWRLLLLAGLSLVVLGVAGWQGRLDPSEIGLLCGMAPGALLLLAVMLWRRRARRMAREH